VNDGERLNVVQELLGHTNPRTTQRYAHLSPDRLGKAAETVASILKDLDGPKLHRVQAGRTLIIGNLVSPFTSARISFFKDGGIRHLVSRSRA
jgi:hypothetical protein